MTESTQATGATEAAGAPYSDLTDLRFHLDVFEGPLDLLLHLIKKNDLTITAVSIAQVTDQYLQHLEHMNEVDIDVASEFLVIAAELAYIKSRVLLPNPEPDDTEEAEVSAEALVAKLRLYESFREAASYLRGRPFFNRDVFGAAAIMREPDDEAATKPVRTLDPDAEYAVDSFELIKALHDVLSRLPKQSLTHQIITERVSVTDRLYEILDIIKQRESVEFTDLLASANARIDVIVTFLAILELAKLHLAKIYQIDSLQPIRIRCLETALDFSESQVANESTDTYQ